MNKKTILAGQSGELLSLLITVISARQFGTLLLLLSAIALLQPPCNSLTFTASGHVQDFHPIDIEHAEHTKKAPHKCEVLFIFIRKNRLQIRITDLPP